MSWELVAAVGGVAVVWAVARYFGFVGGGS
jgi:hypothetical protein